MVQRIETIDTIRTIDQVLHSSKNAVSFQGDRYVEPLKAVGKIDSTMDRLHLEPSKEQVKKWAYDANRVVQRLNAHLSFRVHEGTCRTIVEVVDRDTKEVLREIPPEKMLDVIAGIWKWSGIAVDRKE